MFGRWRRIRADRKRWAQARTLPELGELMARWLEGDLALWPGYQPGYGPDDETTDLIPVLARVNRAGFVTDSSQPALDGPGFGGRRWRQRAAVCGLVGDEQMLFALAQVAEAHRLTILVRTAVEHSCRPGVTVTKVDGESYTGFGDQLSRRQLRHMWRGVSRPALDEIAAAWQVTLVDPEYGRNDRLWAALDEALDLAKAVA